jgi:hypothetical protein
MDSLIQNIKKVTLDKESVDDLVCSLSKFNALGKRKCEVERSEFNNNHSKLLLFDSFFTKLGFQEQKQLHKPLQDFLVIVDKKTQQYLMEIEWGFDEEILEQTQIISQLFFKSLATNNCFDKLKIILEAYSKIEELI